MERPVRKHKPPDLSFVEAFAPPLWHKRKVSKTFSKTDYTLSSRFWDGPISISSLVKRYICLEVQVTTKEFYIACSDSNCCDVLLQPTYQWLVTQPFSGLPAPTCPVPTLPYLLLCNNFYT
jgi:hypothetical protein